MALTLGDNFSYQGAKPLDGRLKYDTLAAMKAVADATMYDGCMAYCTGTDKTYQWKSTNTVDETLGRWREFSSGGGGGTEYTAGDGIDITNNVISTKQSESGDMDEIVDVLPAGGTGVMLVNAFNRGDLYSTDEKMIGQWYDKKPLYQKTVYVELTSGDVSQAHGIDSLETVVSVDVISTPVSGGNQRRPIPNLYQSDSDWSANVIVTDNLVSIESGSDFRSRQSNAYVTIKYTKTTDSAISIGTANEYSTDEKIVGTWITGEPLWQKTINGINTPSSGDTDTIVYEFDSSVDMIHKIVGYAVDTTIPSQKGTLPINIYYNDNVYVTVFAGDKASNNQTKVLSCRVGDDGWHNAPLVLTVQYTKTT